MNKYTFKPYLKIFPQLFEKEKERILLHVKNILSIEHIGSTAVPHLGGKGIIDIAIAVKQETMEDASKQLQEIGYEFRPPFSTAERLYFIIYLPDPEEGKRRYHVHLTYPESNDWKGFIAFRNYLRSHPEELENYAELKKQAAAEANQVGEHYRKIKKPMFEKIHSAVDQSLNSGEQGATRKPIFHFAPIKASQKPRILEWLAQDHIKQWIHGVGLQNTLNGIEKFLRGEGTTTYWIGYDGGHPFAFLITSPEGTDAATLDVFICDSNYIGQGLAAPMIRQFLIDHFSHAKRILIDPEATNTRAIHVYQKVGFKIVREFIASWHPMPHYQMELQMHNLLG
jgi:GrpB-like predicted nucleotidyltransferase (UPF0157 family)/RimJ/RimL family protein N-acetyltransferase